jgi:hypothetical protein
MIPIYDTAPPVIVMYISLFQKRTSDDPLKKDSAWQFGLSAPISRNNIL